MHSGELSAARSTMLLTALGGVSQIIGFGYRVVLSRMVGAEVMGLYQLIMPVYSVLLSLTAVGVTTAVSNLTPQYLALGNRSAVRRTLNLSLLIFLCALIPVGVGVVVLCDPISVYLLGDARTQLGLVLLIPCVALTGVENIHKHVFFGAGHVAPPALADVAEQCIRAVAVLGLLLLCPPPYPEVAAGTIVLGMTICEIFSALTLTILARRFLAGLRVPAGGGESYGRLLRRLAALGLPAGCTALLANVMGAANAALIPKLLIDRGLARGEAMALFGVVCGMTLPMLNLPTVLLGSLNRVLIPRLARATALSRPRDVEHQIHHALLLTSATMLPAMGLLCVVGAQLGRLLFGVAEAGAHIVPLALATAFSCYASVLSASLSGTGRPAVPAAHGILCGALQLGLTVALVPVLGMSGFVAALCVCSLAEAIGNGVSVVRRSGIRFQFFRFFGAPALATLLMTFTSNLLFRYLMDTGAPVPAAAAATAVFGILIYLSALQAQGVSLREVARL